MAATALIPARLEASAEEVYRVLSTAVDGAFYWAVNPDLAEPGLDPIRHYMASGWREGRDPAPWFSSRAYAEAYPEIIKAGWNPLHHYLTAGRHEGRDIARSILAETYLMRRAARGEEPAWSFEALTGAWDAADAVAEEAIARYRERVLAETEFDAAFYLAANVDVAKTAIDPLDHFLAGGWREGRDPNATFSVRDYLESYPDIAAADLNPFIHFLSAGRAWPICTSPSATTTTWPIPAECRSACSARARRSPPWGATICTFSRPSPGRWSASAARRAILAFF